MLLPLLALALAATAAPGPAAPAPVKLPDPVAQRLADRMADQCTEAFCMDANTYTVGCKGQRCIVTLHGWTYRGDTPVGAFACSRAVLNGRAVGKTACGEDPGASRPPAAKTLHVPPRRVTLRTA
jgi:hypothetical protein